MKKKEYYEARKLRGNGVSIPEISRRLMVSKGSVSLWVKDIILSDEQKAILRPNYKSLSEENKKRYYLQRQKWQEEGRQKAKEKDPFHIMGSILYWAEGRKTKNLCSVGNTDVNVLKTFVNFIRKYFRIKDEDFYMYVHCYLNNGISIDNVKKYWSNVLNIPEHRILRFIVLNGKVTSGKKKNIHPYGVCDVRLNRTDIVQHIFGAIQEYAGFINDEWIK